MSSNIDSQTLSQSNQRKKNFFVIQPDVESDKTKWKMKIEEMRKCRKRDDAQNWSYIIYWKFKQIGHIFIIEWMHLKANEDKRKQRKGDCLFYMAFDRIPFEKSIRIRKFIKFEISWVRFPSSHICNIVIFGPIRFVEMSA